jgi:phage baseplate assembly protein W
MAKVNSTGGDIMGTGWGFPVAIDGGGGIALAQHEQDIEQAIYIILSTGKGERRMRPNFGCGIHDLVFHPNNATTWTVIADSVEEALGWWEPRIEVTNVEVRADLIEPAKLVINIQYQVKATNDMRNLVYPFYLST